MESCCGGGLFLLVMGVFIFILLMMKTSENDARIRSEIQQRRYNESQSMNRQLEAKFNLYNISSIRSKAEFTNDADSQFRLGIAYMTGVNVARDEAEAMYWLKKAVSQGHKDADKAIYLLQEAKAKAQREQENIDRLFYLHQADEMARKRDEDFLRKMKRGY